MAARIKADKQEEESVAEAPKKRKKVTLRELQRKMREKEQIVQLAVYDYRLSLIHI